MPELKPTLATALLGADGELLHVFPAMPFDPAKATQGYAPCLILPAPRPIEKCPEEWKDGRWVSLYFESVEAWIPGLWNEDLSDNSFEGGYWASIDDCDRALNYELGTPTHIMLPPPSPEEANHA